MSQTLAAGARSDIPKRAIILLATAAFSSSMNVRACDALLPQIAQSFSVSIGSASLIITTFAIGYGLTQLLFEFQLF